MRFLGGVAGYKFLDKKRNEDIGVELNIFNLIEKLDCLLKVYFDFVQSVIFNNIIIWGCATDIQCEFIIQKIILRVTFNLNTRMSLRDFF